MCSLLQECKHLCVDQVFVALSEAGSMGQLLSEHRHSPASCSFSSAAFSSEELQTRVLPWQVSAALLLLQIVKS